MGFILWALERNPAALDVPLVTGVGATASTTAGTSPIDAQPAAVMLSFSDPAPFTGRIKQAGCKIICQGADADARRGRPPRPGPTLSSHRGGVRAAILGPRGARVKEAVLKAGGDETMHAEYYARARSCPT